MLLPKSRRGGVLCYAALSGFWGLRVLAENRVKKRIRHGFVAALLGVAAFTLAACGRAGPLEPPPGPAIGPSPTASTAPSPSPSSLLGVPTANGQVSAETAQKNGFDAYGNPVAPPSQKKSFFLDFLLN
jgi:predicted small lipoprotein YifL